jgi:phosphatidylinositol-4,5-bisphosphate 3-kinase
VIVNDKILAIAENVKNVAKERRNLFAQSELAALNTHLPPKFQLCLSPRIECKSILGPKCKVMESKKKPLWLAFENADPVAETVLAIFKAGDDLRQDQLTLQLLRIMDALWCQESLDLRMSPYLCCSTGDELGMLEVVKSSDTTAHIQMDYGGKVMGAFKDTPIDNWLRTHNKGALYPVAVDNFVHSCAGYCVATYVLGIGDRHADNIMVTKGGHLFHIDFGHFLGNFKSKFGVKRERAPFVFTPEMAYVMGSPTSETFNSFENMSCEAYNLVREHSSLFMSLFLLMVPASMPECMEADDITYLRTQLSLEMTKDQADKKFKQEIKNSLNTVSRRVDNWIHNLKHG